MKLTNLARPSRFGLPFLFGGLLFAAFLSGCVASRFNQKALEYSVSLGKDLPALMEKATKAYSSSEADVKAALAKVDEAYQHAQGLKKNADVAEQWRILRDEQVQPFFTRWKDKGKLDKDFITPAVKIVKESLASIERAEKAKPK